MTIQTDFEERFPTLTWQPWVESVWSSYTCLEYNDKNKEAILNLIAHLLVLDEAPGTGAARTEQSKTVGSVSVSYGTSENDGSLASFFNTTRYGQRFWLLTGRQVGARFL